MLARVATWEGGDADAIREAVSDINSRADSGPPEGVPSTGFMLLTDPEGGRVIAVALFETDDDYLQGDRTLNEMSPPGGGFGQRASVAKYEVAVDVRAP
jgi:hypothetical protein